MAVLSMGTLSLVVLIVQNSLLVLMTRYSRFEVKQGQKPYHTSSLVLNQEIAKFVFCMFMLAYERNTSGIHQFSSTVKAVLFQFETVKLALPAALFTMQNYLIFVALAHLDAMTFQVVSQTKLLSAAIFSVWLLEKRLVGTQWLSLVILTLGVLLAQGQGDATKGKGGSQENSFTGIMACVISGLSSSFAGVYFEKVVKTTPPSLAVRNIQLGVFAIPFSMLSMVVLDISTATRQKPFHFFQGYNSLVWCLVMIHAFGGLLVAVVVKYADNILKGFATGIAIVVSGVFSSLVWGFFPSLSFVGGCVLVVGSSVMYHYADQQQHQQQKLKDVVMTPIVVKTTNSGPEE